MVPRGLPPAVRLAASAKLTLSRRKVALLLLERGVPCELGGRGRPKYLLEVPIGTLWSPATLCSLVDAERGAADMISQLLLAADNGYRLRHF